MRQEPQIERPEREDNSDVHHQSLPNRSLKNRTSTPTTTAISTSASSTTAAYLPMLPFYCVLQSGARVALSHQPATPPKLDFSHEWCTRVSNGSFSLRRSLRNKDKKPQESDRNNHSVVC